MAYEFLKKPNGKYKLLAKKKSATNKSNAEVALDALQERNEQEKHEC